MLPTSTHSNIFRGDTSMTTYSIYKITNKITSKVYVGLTNNPEVRFKKHIWLSTKPNKQLIHHSINKHGSDNFKFDVVYQTKEVDHAKKMESFFISEENSMCPNGYNAHPGGNYTPLESRNTNKARQRMLSSDNPGITKESIEKKSSTILAQNILTKETIIVSNRKEFSETYNIPYSSIGWAVQHNKCLNNTWKFEYINKRTMGA